MKLKGWDQDKKVVIENVEEGVKKKDEVNVRKIKEGI